MATIVTFRPTPEAQEVLDRIKEEGTNVSAYLNRLIVTGAAEKEKRCTRILYIPEVNRMLYRGLIGPGRSALTDTVPVGRLSARRFREFIDVLAENGMQHHYFRIDDDHHLGIISHSREAASEEFARYYIQDPKTKEYVRTSIPLPTVRYDAVTGTVLMFIAESEILNS